MKATKPSLIAMLGAGALCTLLLAACETTAPAKNWDGLELKPVKGVDAVYLLPGVTFKAYNSVLLDPVVVAFDKDWDPNQDRVELSRRLSTEDIEKIRTDMAAGFREVFAKELGDGGYPIVDQADHDTLRVTAALANVYINAPDKMSAGRTITLTNESGRMTLVMELRDGPTGQLIGRVVDQKIGDNFGRMQVTNSVTNSADFRRLVDSWATKLRQALDRLRADAG